MSKVITKSIKMPDGAEITIETGKLAKQADGSVVVRMGNTMLLATVVSAQDAKEDVDFLPLSVDYQEKFASAGKIPGGFLKREGRLSDHEVLISRLVDRALRPLFPDDYHADTQVMISMISHDENVMPDSLAALAASAALAVSDIPFNGPISEVRVVKNEGEYIVNPSKNIAKSSELDIIVAADKDNIMMVEGEMKEVSEADLLEAMKVAHEAIKVQCAAQIELTEEVGATEKRTYDHEKKDEALLEKMKSAIYDKLYASVAQQTADKALRSANIKAIKDEFIESLGEDHEYDGFLLSQYFKKLHKSAARNFVLEEQKRLDGREFTQIRPISCEVDYLPSAHGSAVFTRGETQSLTSCTLGTKLDEQMIDGATEEGYNKFILHYNFPGFSTGEVRPNRGPGRREVGHGNLALRALKQVLPPEEENPYTIRLVSDILESNGSSSMATVCAGSLAMMDTGVKISAPVSGIAMGMISDSETGKYAILSDILGDEDHLGDMDFKVTGTSKGITACQMDIKVDGLSYEVLETALNQAKEGRLHILNEMTQAIEEPREDFKPHVPRSHKMTIPQDMIGAVIGPGGKVIQEIQKETGATINIEEVDNKGVVSIFAIDDAAMQAALGRIKAIVAMPEVGETYDGKVKSIMPFGAFVEFMPGKDGLLHISEIKWERLENMEGILEVGEEVTVKLIGIDKKSGKFRLSRKALLPKPEKKEA
ncbi:polyribonucleotide nucleotidyltransferase [Roseivirga pacifica]|uniref:Polyribonucleotide nucleotidyltransferase n=1 Tax=Roseivirga pacifica TaxID=1267423 RepID=A0A1I0Q107_9BACT|nr:polyribonucleotide nucleotidyltransferase [Roseivirga pacifica]MCO6360419.1 polyribonucleotide nucleotidyltransferase [Roseivirga pacifica]MCO6368308.1 polyribonucleotide nucleotidyltransferase [Roseivirga pacifica]MCO6372450.1 polyribonucleotide nucleotidyltransferase [Roseivirga pacifica]MCO6376508.1 polyribonucleotide nucleotidyltransferase [Roseivirga pacifica]MCO6378212.1 polyribonucleotide nucleotidyltransferase [Roseivirga pacifica]